jgi:hypothetical protein
MSELDPTGTDTEQPADDIRSSLTAAIAESEGASTENTESVAKTEADETPAAGETRERGPDGKFLKKETTSADSSTKTATAEKTDPVDPAAPTAVDTKEPPTHWSQADKDKFKAQAPEAKAFILDRLKAMEGDYTRKTQEIANFKKEYGPVDEMFAPHKDVLRQKGFTPRSLIEAWANVETKLAAGTDSAVEVIKGLMQGYQIPVEKLASALGITRQQAAQVQQQPGQQPTAVENGQVVALPPQVEAELKALREQVGSFGQKFQTIEQREAQQRRATELQQEQAVENQVNEFRNSKDDKGNLMHPHMAEVEGMMTALANAALASKQPVPSLKELYETAIYAHPDVRQKVLTAQRQQEETKRTEEARAKAASARKAGSSVTGAPGPGQAPNGKSNEGLSLKEQLDASYDEHAAA